METEEMKKGCCFGQKMEVQESANKDVGRFSAIISTDDLDNHGDKVMPSAFTKSIETINNNKIQGKKALPLLWNHESKEPIGQVEAIQKEDNKVVMEGALNLKSKNGNEAYAHISNKDLNYVGLSVGFAYSRKDCAFKNGVRIINDLELKEVSLTPLPSNESTAILAIKNKDIENSITREEVEELINKKVDEVINKKSQEQQKQQLQERYKKVMEALQELSK